MDSAAIPKAENENTPWTIAAALKQLDRFPKTLGLPRGSDSKESACNVGDLGSIPGLGRSPGGVHGNPLQYSYLDNPIDRGAWGLQSMGLQRVRHD